MRNQMRMALDLLPYRLTEEIRGWIDTFRPEMIYSMLGSARVCRLVLSIAAARSLPIIPHFMDDWPRTLYRDSVFAPWLRMVMNQQLRQILRRAPIRLAIGDEMAVAYNSRYGGSFLPFMNCVELETNSDPPPHSAVRLVYLGGLHLNRWQSLAEIGAAAEAVSRGGTAVELLIYTSPQGSAQYEHLLNRPPYMRLVGYVAPEDVAAVQKDADVLVHVEAFDQRSRNYTRYSVSTKIPEYMAAARPILAYGPPEAASLKYVAGSDCGITVSEQSPIAIQSALTELASSPSTRMAMGLRGRKVAEARHKAESQRAEFLAALREAVSHEQ